MANNFINLNKASTLSRRHRLRRPLSLPDRERTFLQKVSKFAAEAWSQWQRNAEALNRLTEIPLDNEPMDSLRSRLRQAPFFLSLRVINKVIHRIQMEAAEHNGKATLYDLYNAMTFLGTHDLDLSHTYNTRLRVGAGELTRRDSRVCEACQQLLLT